MHYNNHNYLIPQDQKNSSDSNSKKENLIKGEKKPKLATYRHIIWLFHHVYAEDTQKNFSW